MACSLWSLVSSNFIAIPNLSLLSVFLLSFFHCAVLIKSIYYHVYINDKIKLFVTRALHVTFQNCIIRSGIYL